MIADTTCLRELTFMKYALQTGYEPALTPPRPARVRP